jgi:hypothetical protein
MPGFSLAHQDQVDHLLPLLLRKRWCVQRMAAEIAINANLLHMEHIQTLRLLEPKVCQSRLMK